MPRKRHRPRRPELLIRSVEISSVAARVGIRVDQLRREEPEIDSGPWLEVRGTLDEPVKVAQDVLCSLSPAENPRIGPARPAGIGTIIGLTPQMTVVVSWSHRNFDRLWAMALAGKLSFAHLVFTKPHYGKGKVVNLSFSNEPEE